MTPVISALFSLALLAQAGGSAAGIDAFRQGRYPEARIVLEQALALNPSDRTAAAFLAMTRAAQRNCSPAADQFASESDPVLARMTGLAAVECLTATDQPDSALALLAKLEARYPAEPDVLYQAAKLHRKAWDRAIFALYQKAPASYRVNQISAEVFETEGKYREAAAQYQAASAKAPEALNLHFRLGRCLLLDGASAEHLEQARLEFLAELKLNPYDAAAVYQLGQILAAQQKPDEALARYEQALKLNPDFTSALVAVGQFRARAKQYPEAAQLFEKAVALQPANEAAHYNLMLAYRSLGRPADALAQKNELDRLQKPPEGEFTRFLNKLGEKAPAQ